MIDLHVHSTFSDGALPPEALVEAAVRAGLGGMALTDHDTLDGIPSFLSAAAAHPGFRAIAGVEVSVAHEHGPLHILAYFVSPGGPLEPRLAEIRRGREERNASLFRRLEELGIPVDPDEVARTARGGLIARPHFARAMVERGWVASRDEAFERYLARGRPAYVDRFRYPAAEMIAAIRAGGGVTVLAHPGLLRCEGRRLAETIEELAGAGLGGLEVWHSRHAAEKTRRLLRMARRFDLVPTGGSDYHGDSAPGLRLGAGSGAVRAPDDMIDRLAARAAARV